MAGEFLPPVVISIAVNDAPALAQLAGLKGAMADTAAASRVSATSMSSSAGKVTTTYEGMGAGAAAGASGVKVAEKDAESASKGFSGRMAMMFESMGNSMSSFGIPFGNSVKKMGYAMKEGESGAKGFGSSLQGLSKIASLSAIAIGGVLVAAALKAGAATTEANARLMTAAQDTGKSMVGVEASYLKTEKAGVKLGFMTDETAESLTSLTVASHSSAKAVELQSLAENLSAMRKVPLMTATKALVQLYGGSERALKQMGVQLDTGSMKLKTQVKDTEALTKAKANLKTAEEGMAVAVKKSAEEHEKAEAKVASAEETLSRSQETLKGGSESLAAAQHTLTEAQKGVTEAAEKEKTAIKEAAAALKSAEEAARETAESGAKGIAAAKTNLSNLEQERAKEGNEAGIKKIESEESVLKAVKSVANEQALALLGGKKAQLEAADKGMEAQKKEQALTKASQGIIEAEATAHKNNAKAIHTVETAHEKLVKAQKAGLASSKENEAAANKVATAQKGVSVAERTLSGDLANVQKATDGLSLAQKEAAAPSTALAAAQEKLKKAHEAVSVASLKVKKDSSALGEVLANLAKISMGQAQKASETTTGKLRVLRATLNEVAAEISKKLEPAIMKLAEAMLKIIGFFKQHTTAAKALAIALGLVAIAWPITKVIGLFTAISKLLMLGRLASLARGAAVAIGLIGTAEVGTEAAALPLLATFGAIALAIGGIVAVAEVASRLLGKGSFIENAKELISGGTAKYENMEANTKGQELANQVQQKLLNKRREQKGMAPVKFALGGIVSKPTVVEVGEAGPEAIIPLASGGLTAPPGFTALPAIPSSGTPGSGGPGGLNVQNLTVNGMSTPNAQVVQELYSRLRPLLI